MHKAAKNNAVTKRPDGIVLIDPDKSKGQRQIVDSVRTEQSGGMRKRTYRSIGILMHI